jgi:putative MATE family efflux protein
MSITTAPIPSLVRGIALPASIGFFFNTMYNFVDTYCAGLIGTDAVAALSLSFPVFFIVLAVGSGLSQGATALIANAMGADDMPLARRLFAQALLLSLLVSAVLTIQGMVTSRWLFELLGAEGNYLTTALDYMNVIMAGAVFFIMQMTLNAGLNAQGNATLYRNVLIAGFVANCALNPWFMYGGAGVPAMGVAGIALATIVVQIASCWILWRGLRKGQLCQGMTSASFIPEPSLLRRLAGQGIPAAGNMLTVALGIFVITWFISRFSKEAVAAYGIATRIEQMLLLPTIGLNTAALTLVGQNNGAGLYDRVRLAWLTCIRYGLVMTLIGGAILWLIRDWAMKCFTTDPLVIQCGIDYLGVAAWVLAAYPILFTTVSMLQGLKRPLYSLCIGLYRQILAPAVVYYGLAIVAGWQLWGVWYGIGMVTWSAALFTLWWGWRTVRSLGR